MYFRLLLCLGACAFLFSACRQNHTLYSSANFTVLPDRVKQGNFEAIALSPTEIRSNYVSTASAQFSRLIRFKVSINEKDNENPPGLNHWVLIGGEEESPVKTFGVPDGPEPEGKAGFLPPNHRYTFRVNMAPVLRQFAAKGFYEAYDGSRVSRSDWKGFYLAGGSEPLTWDFVNLEEQGLKLEDKDGDSVYTLTVVLNPLLPEDTMAKTWKLTRDVSAKPRYQSEQPLVDALFNLSLEEALKNIEADSTLRTGAKWGGVWTRDISFSILLAFAYHEPEVAKISLMKKVKRRRIVQDTGSGGSWPVSSDRTAWALAAWEIYKVTGDTAWLRNAYEIIKNTLADDAKTIGITASGLYSGESSFLDWREQTYPRWMDNRDIYQSENLGTNAVHYQAHLIAAQMATLLQEDATGYAADALALRNSINQHLWMPDKGYHAQYRYGRLHSMPSPRFEALGEAFSVLFDIADAPKAASILSRSPITEFGVTCIFPQVPEIPPYHNNGIWPFVQSFWNLASAKQGHEEALTHGLASLYRPAALFLTNYENFVAETGDYVGTEINSDRMLWSIAGNLAMVHRIFAGMQFETNGIRFSPAIPAAYGGTRTLSHFTYRGALLDITVKGTGRKVKSFRLDGRVQPEAFLPAGLTGKHTIEIEMDNKPFPGEDYQKVANHFSTADPRTRLEGGELLWQPIEGAKEYHIYRNGKKLKSQKETRYLPLASDAGEFAVTAVDAQGFESFASEPLWLGKTAAAQWEMESFAAPVSAAFSQYSGKGAVEVSVKANTALLMELDVPQEGMYALDFRYANGNGPWNTDNKCALRSLYANDKYQGVMVFPQRGKDEWSDWGFSNTRVVRLAKGKNRLLLKYDEWNTNMNGEENKAYLDLVRLRHLP
jgi:hypothetical protein